LALRLRTVSYNYFVKCPSCQKQIPVWALWRNWSAIECPSCRVKLGRRRNLQHFLNSLACVLGVAGCLYAGFENLISWPAAKAILVLWLILYTFIDSATMQLVPAEPYKHRVRNFLVVLAVMIAVPVLAVPVIYYVTAISPSNCRDWQQAFVHGQASLRRCHDPKERFYILGDTAKAAVEVSQYAGAEKDASELLRLAASYRKDWNYGNAIHDGHVVLGRVALARGDRVDARRELLLAGTTPGSPQLNTFGPNMSLARDMLRAGEKQTVFTYFDECDRFWKYGHGSIKRWKTLARFHLPPDFGANLLF
jgi:hypothetical protein